MKLIPLKGKYGEGKFTKVSDCDFDFASGLSLYVNDGYVKTYYNGRHWKLHQLLVGSNFDHANQDKLDNTRENLRPATTRQNNANVKARGESGFKGVIKDSTCNSYKAIISVDGKMVHLGNFRRSQGDERAKHLAALVVDLWELDLHGEFAKTNLPIVAAKVGKS